MHQQPTHMLLLPAAEAASGWTACRSSTAASHHSIISWPDRLSISIQLYVTQARG